MKRFLEVAKWLDENPFGRMVMIAVYIYVGWQACEFFYQSTPVNEPDTVSGSTTETAKAEFCSHIRCELVAIWGRTCPKVSRPLIQEAMRDDVLTDEEFERIEKAVKDHQKREILDELRQFKTSCPDCRPLPPLDVQNFPQLTEPVIDFPVEL